jgi:hypothetical protein
VDQSAFASEFALAGTRQRRLLRVERSPTAPRAGGEDLLQRSAHRPDGVSLPEHFPLRSAPFLWLVAVQLTAHPCPVVAAVQVLVLSAALGVDLTPTSPDLPVFGPGPVTNLSQGGAALTNASAHVGWSLAFPLAGRVVGGRKGMWIAGLSWIAYSLANESFFHEPSHPGQGYPAEVRTDLISRIVPCATVLLLGFLHDHRASLDSPGRVAPPRPQPLAAPELDSAVRSSALDAAERGAVLAAEQRLKAKTGTLDCSEPGTCRPLAPPPATTTEANLLSERSSFVPATDEAPRAPGDHATPSQGP